MPSISLNVFGVVVGIQTFDAALLELIDAQLPPFPRVEVRQRAEVTYRVAQAATGQLAVVRGRRTLTLAVDVADAAAWLVNDLQSTVARLAPGWTFVHSGVVAIDGRALLLPAASHAGKSTLVARLLQTGAAYGSDEFAAIDSAGLVHPYARKIALRGARGQFDRTTAEMLGGHLFDTGLPVGAVLFTSYEPGATFVLTPVSPGELVLRLLQHCLGARSRPDTTLTALAAVASTARGFLGVRGEADDATRRIIDLARRGWREAEPV